MKFTRFRLKRNVKKTRRGGVRKPPPVQMFEDASSSEDEVVEPRVDPPQVPVYSLGVRGREKVPPFRLGAFVDGKVIFGNHSADGGYVDATNQFYYGNPPVAEASRPASDSDSDSPVQRKKTRKNPVNSDEESPPKESRKQERKSSPTTKREFTKLDHIYNHFQDIGRSNFFARIKANCDVWPVLSTSYGGDAHANNGSAFTVNFDTPPLFSSRKMSSLKTVVESGRSIGWVPIKLMRINYSTHANAIWISNPAKRIVLFEPHGSDASHPRHPVAFQGMYDSATYFKAFRQACAAEFPTYHVVTPDMYEPSVFGQSTSRVQDSSDPWCVLWTLLFFYRMTFKEKGDYRAFVTFIDGMAHDGALADFVKRLLTDTSWTDASECRSAKLEASGSSEVSADSRRKKPKKKRESGSDSDSRRKKKQSDSVPVYEVVDDSN